MKKTAIVLVSLASSAAASAAPRLTAHESANAHATPVDATPEESFDAWLAATYGENAPSARTAAETLDDPSATAERFINAAARSLGTARRVATRLLAPALPETVAERPPVTYPRVDGYGDIVCGNVATKGGRKRVCRDRSGVKVPYASLELD